MFVEYVTQAMAEHLPRKSIPLRAITTVQLSDWVTQVTLDSVFLNESQENVV